MTNDDIIARLCKKIAQVASQEAKAKDMTQEDYVDALIAKIVLDAAATMPANRLGSWR